MVEWKKLSEIGDVCMCKRIMKHQTFDKGDVPFFKIGTFGGNADAFINRDLFLDYKLKYSFPQKGEILLSASGTIGRTVVYNGEDAYFQDSNIVWISNDETQVTNSFLYYCYQIVDWKIDGGTIKRLYNYNLKNTIIPVPSLSEQNRIVGILDTFTASIENLKEQITQRRKQFEHYRDQLLELKGKEGVEMKTLGEICTVITGGEVPEDTIKGQLSPSTEYPYAVYTNGKETYGFTKSYQVESDAVCISSIGANTGAVFYKEGKFTPAIRLKVLIPIQKLNTRFLYYAASKIDFRGKNTGSVPNINANYVKSKEIPVPSLFEQQRIVSILDTFEASIANLEAQLSQREKQYDYYRNKLLTFE